MPASLASAGTAASAEVRRSWAHRLSLFAVWLTFLVSGVVFSEPTPVDALMLGLMLLLPAVGLLRITEATLGYLVLWLIVAAGGIIACTLSRDFDDSAIFTGVSIYLTLASFVLAAFITRNPQAHTRLILNGYLMTAFIAAAAGLAGYFSLLPGAYDLFTKFGRAAGTFKDPNVFGTFLIPPAVYALHLAIERPLARAILPLIASAVLVFAVFLSFSRGAWMALAISIIGYGYLVVVTSASPLRRIRVAALAGAGVILAAAGILAALQIDSVASLLGERASLTQSYDVGPEGRFGGQEKAQRLILDHPFGIGAKQFAAVYHREEVHNVYLSMLLNAGWMGGGAYALVVMLTLTLGARHLFRSLPTQPLFQIAYICFLAIALEGFIIDTDHWRHFYLLLSLVWGLMAVSRPGDTANYQPSQAVPAETAAARASP
jgi:O-antigen ligase